jgi:glycosyltransferase involved in cell wall biosynthesis
MAISRQIVRFLFGATDGSSPGRALLANAMTTPYNCGRGALNQLTRGPSQEPGLSIASRAFAGTPASSRTLSVLLALGPAVGGMAQHVANLVRGLDRSRFEVAVAGPPGDLAADAARAASCAVHPLTFRSSPAPAALGAVRLAGLVRREGFNLVHAHGYAAAGAAALARRLAPHARLVCTVHNFLTGTGAQPVAGWRACWLLGLIARRADRIITVSDSLRAQFEGIPGVENKLVTISNGIDLAAFAKPDPAQARRELGLGTNRPVVGMVGRLAAQKGPLDFVRAASLVSQRIADARFVLIGDGPLREAVEQLADELGISDRVILAGHRPDAPTLIQAFDVVVVPSLSEGSSLTAMEAMAWSRPVVGTAVGGVREVIADGETGTLVPPGDTQALTEAIVSLLSDPERAQNWGEAGRRRVEREFSLRLMIERIEQTYLETVHSERERGSGACG